MDKKKTIWSGITGVVASVLAFLGVVSCCGMPIRAGILATVGIGASQLSFFAEYRGWFIAFAIISLIYGFYQAYFRKKSCCCSETSSAQQKKGNSIMPKVFLWIGTVITVLALFMGTPESNASQTSGCCPVENTGGCGEGCTAGGCASGGCSAQGNGNCCSSVSKDNSQSSCCPSQAPAIKEGCCGN